MESCSRRPRPRLTLATNGALVLLLALPGLVYAAGASFSTVRAQLSAAPLHTRQVPGRGAGCAGRWRSVPQAATESHAVPAVAPPGNSLARGLWNRDSDRRHRRRSPEPGCSAEAALRGAGHTFRARAAMRTTSTRRSAGVFHEAHAPPASSRAVVPNQS